jgi:hypothetical protein
VSTDWQDYALCASADNPDDWDIAVADKAARTRARATCWRCPVMAQCLDWAQDPSPEGARAIGLILAGYAWRWPSLEPRDVLTEMRVKRPA